jgi:4'-phosphopantetheinyl transferase EntD
VESASLNGFFSGCGSLDMERSALIKRFSCQVGPIASTMTLLPEEAISIGECSKVRLMEFATGRHLARDGLRRLGVGGSIAIEIARKGAPLWPNGIYGSISHSKDLAIVAVMRSEERVGIGCDVEVQCDLSEDAADLFLSSNEQKRIGRWPIGLIDAFSAKEAAAKAVSSCTGMLPDFRDLECVDARSSVIVVRTRQEGLAHRHLSVCIVRREGSIFSVCLFRR